MNYTHVRVSRRAGLTLAVWRLTAPIQGGRANWTLDPLPQPQLLLLTDTIAKRGAARSSAVQTRLHRVRRCFSAFKCRASKALATYAAATAASAAAATPVAPAPIAWMPPPPSLSPRSKACQPGCHPATDWHATVAYILPSLGQFQALPLAT